MKLAYAIIAGAIAATGCTTMGSAAGDEMILVPVAPADERRELLLVANRTDNLGLLSRTDARDLAPQRVEGASALFVILSGVGVPTIDIRLRARQGEGQAGDRGAVVVDATVACIRDLILRLELEVAGQGSVPDDESIPLHDGLGSNLADDRSAFVAPILRIASPAFEGLAVEEALPSQAFFSRRDGHGLFRRGRDDFGGAKEDGGQ
jgi:hypothetical protein